MRCIFAPNQPDKCVEKNMLYPTFLGLIAIAGRWLIKRSRSGAALKKLATISRLVILQAESSSAIKDAARVFSLDSIRANQCRTDNYLNSYLIEKRKRQFNSYSSEIFDRHRACSSSQNCSLIEAVLSTNYGSRRLQLLCAK